MEIKNLSIYYRTRDRWIKAVNDVSLSLERGESLGIVGESGCGKSTLALSILRVLPENAKIHGGEIIFENMDILKLQEEQVRRDIRWKKISMIFQSALNALDPVTKVGDLLIEVMKKKESVTDKEAKERIITLFETLRLNPLIMKSYPHELSGGMKQRVIIAMSLLCRPDLIIADEPTTALDVITQDQILNEIDTLRKKLNTSLILISHNISIVAETCERMAVMYGGRIFEIAKTITLFNNPVNPYTIGLLNSIPSVKGKIKKIKGIPGEPVNLLNPPTGCLFHPRCNFAKDICKQLEPQLIQVESGHYSRCHFVHQLPNMRGEGSRC